MYFIVESGSTKSDWVLVDSKNNQSFYSTMGFNPYFHSSELIENELKKHVDILAVADEILGVYFYGAGCSSDEMNKIVEIGLQRIFKNASVLVNHDLLACAYATYSGKPGISCIIGTGSNSCLFDGEELSEVVPALGYILGDEGSGSYFGKQLLSNFLYHKLPANVEADFIATYKLDKDQIVNHVYREPNANVYIASFMPFIAKHKEEAFFSEMVYQGFKKFMEVHVCCYPNFEETEVHFVGSLSKIFEAELNQAASELGISITSIIQKPVSGLVNYHLNYILNQQTIKSC
ncbi:MAG: ATPase [Crocinitomicaceae bacterium]|jgi:glucosamine kinase|nr:ATPase [Crocinitomicaceae bacterium]MDP4761665.1 ATPase [Crocinitomicaceae bacterium]